MSLNFHNYNLLNGSIHYIIETIFLTTFVQKRHGNINSYKKKKTFSSQRQTFHHPHNCLILHINIEK